MSSNPVSQGSKRNLACFGLAVQMLMTTAVSAITITSNYVEVRNHSIFDYFIPFSGTAIPSSATLEHVVQPGVHYARAQIDYSGSGNHVTLLNDFELSRDESIGDSSQFSGATYFIASADVSYDLSGAHTVQGQVDMSSRPGSVYLSSVLIDLSLNTVLSLSVQDSRNTRNESFVLGGFGGDFDSRNEGSLTGSLIAGHGYAWVVNAYLQASQTQDEVAPSTGFLRLDIGGGASSAPVPEGGFTYALYGLALAAVSGFGSLRRKV